MVGILVKIASAGVIGTILEKVLNEMGQSSIADYVRVCKCVCCASLALAEVFKLFQQIGLM